MADVEEVRRATQDLQLSNPGADNWQRFERLERELSFSDVADCDSHTRHEFLKFFDGLTPTDRAVVGAIWVGKAQSLNAPAHPEARTPDSVEIAKYLARADQRTREPWRVHLDNHQAAVDSMFADRDASRRELVQLGTDLAKQGH